jgi:hypothetical protein
MPFPLGSAAVVLHSEETVMTEVDYLPKLRPQEED